MSFTRVRAFFVLGVLVLAAIIVVVVAIARDTQAGAAAAQECPAGAPRVTLTLPDEAGQVKLRVLNGTKTPGLADQVTQEFKNRGFVMQKAGENNKKLAKIAVVRYGPKTVGAAHWIRAFFLGQAEPQYNPKRTSDVIDIVVGAEYRQLATRTEVNQSLAQLSEPQLPPGSCLA
ncbi:LytR C-terminal domain-containing protein [Paractinoplanes lichenicola]|uniref:LytR C-terminal domain-containing protein n=1 Tax=Paractinoplanes lichenicola TaxID=2802976 RepID=A0ABS1VDS9_9ACTN|nr:LytR C-terminal domain-containing protein [Actinoplanes lichenicola]MBL7252836.1 LytR C-terminal domain-containing protein [Actinoplanes lichenicola]